VDQQSPYVEAGTRRSDVRKVPRAVIENPAIYLPDFCRNRIVIPVE
jgi:hypothetical protein